ADKNKVERVIVLRTSPEKLYDRLKNRGWEKRKIEENIDSEELSVILLEAKSCYGNKVIEINTDDDIATTMKKIFEALL
ncbi:MAG: AAA family ATPase, partial [Fervidicoccus fontis]